VAEPWFLAVDAHIEFHPAMNLDDLKNATQGIEKAVKNYRRMAHAKAA
jgi:divalent metal cation (Fe/Co/Zn/Cd) transporter